MLGTESVGADNTSYNSSPSHIFLTSVDETLRADNLSPSSSQGSPARSEDQMTELKPACVPASDSALSELEPLRKPKSNISDLEFPVVSAGYSAFSSIKSDSSCPTCYNSLISAVAQAPANFSLHTPTAPSSTNNSTVTTPTSTNPSYYSSLNGMTSPIPESPSYYSSLNGITTPTSASPSYYSSLNGITSPTSASPSHYGSLERMTTPTPTSPSYYSLLNGMTTPHTDYTQYTTPTYVIHPSLTPTFLTNSSPTINSPFSQYKCEAESSSLLQYTSNEGTSPLSQNVIVNDSSPLYRPGESHESVHGQHSALTNCQQRQSTSPIADYNPTPRVYTAPIPRSVYTAPKPRSAYTVPKPRSVSVKPSSLQEMEEERSVSRARKQRTIFTEKQVR